MPLSFVKRISEFIGNIVFRKSIAAGVNRPSLLHKPSGCLDVIDWFGRSVRNGGDGTRGSRSRPIFIVLLFARVDHESVRCDVVDRRDAVYSDCQQARYWSNIRHRVCVPYAHVNRLTSAYIFRLFRNSLRSILRSRRFTGYGTASEGERISGISIRVPARRERPEFAFDSQPRTRRESSRADNER